MREITERSTLSAFFFSCIHIQAVKKIKVPTSQLLQLQKVTELSETLFQLALK
jgi:hypothetical protein